MIALSRILVATELTEPLGAGFEQGQTFAAAFGAEIHLLYVVTEPLHHPWAGYTPGPALLELLEQHQADARQELERLLRRDDLAGRRVVVAAAWGDPADEVLKYSCSHQIDLIVCGTHGRSGWNHLVMGSVAERIVRLAACPVLTVRVRADIGCSAPSACP